jgi:hypothetical protein
MVRSARYQPIVSQQPSTLMQPAHPPCWLAAPSAQGRLGCQGQQHWQLLHLLLLLLQQPRHLLLPCQLQQAQLLLVVAGLTVAHQGTCHHPQCWCCCAALLLNQLVLLLLLIQQLPHLVLLSLDCHQVLLVLVLLQLVPLQVTKQKVAGSIPHGHHVRMSASVKEYGLLLSPVQAYSRLGALQGSAATRAVVLLLMLTVLLLHELASIVFLVCYLFVNLNVFNFFLDLWPRGFSHACCFGVVGLHGPRRPSKPASFH